MNPRKEYREPIDRKAQAKYNAVQMRKFLNRKCGSGGKR